MKPSVSQLCRLLICVSFLFIAGVIASAQATRLPVSGAGLTTSTDARVPTRFRIGEKLSYNISFAKFVNAAYAEMSVVSRGMLSGRDAVELRSKIKTLDLVNAAFFQWDETRSVFVSPDTGLPLFVTRRENNGLTPKETSVNYLKGGTSSFDLLSLIYQAREAGGTGTFPLFENEKLYTVTLVASPKSEHISTQAGEFDTVISIVQSDYLVANGIKEFKINFTADEDHLPVLFRMKTAKGEFRASLMAVQLPKTVAVAAPTPALVRAPSANLVVKPKPTPTPYIDNQPLAPELGFDLGEALEYGVTVKGSPVAGIVLEARERKQFQTDDSLLLTATVTRVEPGARTFVPGDTIQAQVDPETLAPRWMETRFSGELNWLNQTVIFDKRTGAYAVNGGKGVEAPIGTHTLLSLIYAMRSFNLKPSKDPNNPVNDTRVAVFWETQPYIFTLRPSNPETITINGEKVPAQLVTINTANEAIDKQGLKIWLSGNGRVPLRFAFGSYQADLVSNTKKPL